MPKKYDAIIIGSGIGGLTAGAILAKNGKKVLLLEKNNKPGGYASSFAKGNFTFETSLHLISGAVCTAIKNILEKSGVTEELEVLKPSYTYRSIFPNHDISVPQNDLHKYIDILVREFPNEKDNIIKLFKKMLLVFCDINKSYASATSHPNLDYYASISYSDMLSEFTNNLKLKSIIAQLWPYYGLPPTQMIASYFCFLWSDYMYTGAYYPKGGSQTISNKFVDVIKKNSGDVILNTEVKEIIVKRGTAKGVYTKNKGAFFADSIISNASSYETFHKLIKAQNLPTSLLGGFKGLIPSISAYGVYLGLNTNLKNKGITDYEIFVNPSYNINDHFKAGCNVDFKNASLCLTIYPSLNTDVNQSRCSILAIGCLSGYDFWKKLSKKQYKEKKLRLADILIKRSEKIIPNLSSYIKVMEIATPLTCEKYTGNYKGAIYGWVPSISQNANPILKVKTPIQGLYLASAWTRLLAGIGGAMRSGQMVAQEIIKQN